MRHLELVSGQSLHDSKNLVLGCGDAGDVEILVGCLFRFLEDSGYGFADVGKGACGVWFVAGVYEAEFAVLDIDEAERVLEALDIISRRQMFVGNELHTASRNNPGERPVHVNQSYF